MALNTLFQRQKELVNFDFFDIAEGTGVVVYYGAEGDDGEYFVTSNAGVYSETRATFVEGEVLTSSLVKHFDLDFDLTFNRPKNIKGKIFCNIPIGVAAGDDVAKTLSYQAIVIAKHFDGVTETTMATGTSKELQTSNMQTSQTSFDANIMLCVCDVSTITHFKKGETLRFTVEGYFKMVSGSGNTHLMIAHDPKNRSWTQDNRAGAVNAEMEFANERPGGGTVTYQNTQMVFHVPFVLDI